MQTYSDFRPTRFDSRGICLPNRQNWLVIPVCQTRDSGVFDRSNFLAALDMLGGESDNVEVHRFGHWGPGWFEIILVDPASKEAAIVTDIERSLENYPSLDDDVLSRMQYEEAADYWQSLNIRERTEYCARYGVSIFAARRDELPDDDIGDLIDALAPLT